MVDLLTDLWVLCRKELVTIGCRIPELIRSKVATMGP